MKLLTKEIRRNLPPLYSQERLGGKAVAQVEVFHPGQLVDVLWRSSSMATICSSAWSKAM